MSCMEWFRSSLSTNVLILQPEHWMFGLKFGHATAATAKRAESLKRTPRSQRAQREKRRETALSELISEGQENA